MQMSFKVRFAVAGVLTILACVSSPRTSRADTNALPVAAPALSYQAAPSTSLVPSSATTYASASPLAPVASLESESEDDGVIEELLAVDEATTCATTAEAASFSE